MNDQPPCPSPAEVLAPVPQSFHEPVAPSANLFGGILAGLLAAVIGAVVWAAVTCTTKYQIGWMAVGVGFLVGFAVRKFGRGGTPLYGGIGAVLALFGCLLGNYFTIIGFVAAEAQIGVFEALTRLPLSSVPEIMGEAFSVMDLLFYGIAVFEGYKFGSQPPSN
jgi:hypothetical protein